jgi:hypothetical protein
VKGIQPESFYWNSYRFDQGCNKKFYDPVRSFIELLSTCWLFTEGKTYTKFMLDTLFPERRYSNAIFREKCSAYNGVQKKKKA